MTKVDAIEKVMEDNGGTANLSVIYDNILKYYPDAKKQLDWEAGIRGVLYREIKNQGRFKKIGLSIYALKDYVQEKKPVAKDVKRMHSYIEGICIEIGNLKKFGTYTADPSAMYRDNIKLKNIATFSNIPRFSYPEIINEVRRIDVVWFNQKGLCFPQKVFEIVDSVGTLNGAFNRSLQLQNFRTDFYIVAPEQHRAKFEQTVNLETYVSNRERFTFVNYEKVLEWYDSALCMNKLENEILG